MPSRFNTYLRGLLGLLDAKVGGQAPQAIEDAIRLSLQSEPFLYAQRREILALSTAAISGAGEGFSPDALGGGIVPAGELWWVTHYSCNLINGTVLAAAEELKFVPAYRQKNASGTLQYFFLGTSNFNSTVGHAPANAAFAPFYLLPGDELGVWVENIATAAARTITMAAGLVRIPI